MTSMPIRPVTKSRTPFVLPTMQRTGSGWVMDRINNVPSAEGHVELFLRRARLKPTRAGRNDYPRFLEMRPQLPRRRISAVFEYLDGLYQRPGAVGFKLMYSQLLQNPEILAYLFLRRPVRIVHLVRHDLLDMLVSGELARVSGTSHVSRHDPLEKVQVALEPDRIVPQLRRLERKRRLMHGVLALLPNPGGGSCLLGAVPRHRRADENTGTTQLVKRQRASHDEVLLNFREVETVLRRGGYQDFLN